MPVFIQRRIVRVIFRGRRPRLLVWVRRRRFGMRMLSMLGSCDEVLFGVSCIFGLAGYMGLNLIFLDAEVSVAARRARLDLAELEWCWRLPLMSG